MKHIKLFEDLYITWDSVDKRSPADYKYQLGDYVKVKNPRYYRWLSAGYSSDTICIICLVNTIPYNDHKYAIVPIEAPNSNFEEWVTEDEIELAADYEISAMKYNI
jgi:hypothetical protein